MVRSRAAPLEEIIEDYIAVRRATLTLLRNLDEAAWMRRGVANKNEVSVRALAYIIAGHELHHRRILEEKYFRTVGPSSPRIHADERGLLMVIRALVSF